MSDADVLPGLLDVPDGFEPLTGGDSGFLELVGPQYSRIVDGAPVIGLRVTSKHLNYFGGTHGGLLATVADMQGAAIRMLANLGDVATPTVSLAIDYIAPVWPGAWLELHSFLTGQTRTMLFGRAELRSDGELVAQSSGIYKIGKRRDPATGLGLTPHSMSGY